MPAAYVNLIFLVVALGWLVTLCLWLYSQHKANRLRNKIVALQNRLDNFCAVTETQVRVLQNQDEEANTRTIVIAQNVSELQEKVVHLENTHRELQQQDPALKMYQLATRMAKEGGTIDEIVGACDMPFAEAQLLVNLYGKQV